MLSRGCDKLQPGGGGRGGSRRRRCVVDRLVHAGTVFAGLALATMRRVGVRPLFLLRTGEGHRCQNSLEIVPFTGCGHRHLSVTATISLFLLDRRRRIRW